LAGASQLNTLSVGPLNVHSAAAGVTIFCTLRGLAADAAVADAAATDAPTTPAEPDAPIAAAEAAGVPEPASGALAVLAVLAALVTAGADAGTTCSIDPSTTTREPWIPAPAWAIFSLSGDA
jgi:hypothetical protein